MIAIVPARASSKRFPGKNKKIFFGKTLFERAIDQALKSEVFSKIIVSTDDLELSDIAGNRSVEVDQRPPELAGDNTRVVEVVKYLLDKPENRKENEVAVLFITSPFRTVEIIKEAKAKFDQGFDSLLTVTKYPNAPQFALKPSNGGIEPWHSTDFFWKTTRKQDIPDLFYPNFMIQMSTRGVINQYNGFLGRKCAHIEIPIERASDIDTELDFLWAEFLVNQNIVELKSNLVFQKFHQAAT